jgi:hypothetical protein
VSPIARHHGVSGQAQATPVNDAFLSTTIVPRMLGRSRRIFVSMTCLTAAALALGKREVPPPVTGNPEECIT